MIRKEAIGIISKSAKNNPIVSANGFISRDLFESYRNSILYLMIQISLY